MRTLTRAAGAALAALWLGAALHPGSAWALKEGDPFPHFAAPDLSGAIVDTKAFGKKVILIEFWSIYCSSCVQQMPHVVKLYEKYKDQGLQCIGIDMDVYGAARVKKFLDGLDFKVPYPNIIDAKMQIKTLLGVSILPTTIVADTSGKVALFHVGYKPGFEKELEEFVKKLLPGK
ncbi:MAG TPA: TlpA disulfide reductase family protein [Candidatus Methanoperedens sp.]|nr:TlpA disulfide reductase family protein [Candidatus Methanoperedens sp.]